MRRHVLVGLTLGAVVLTVAGCSGLLLLAGQIIGLMRVGEALGLVKDSDPVSYTVYMDGYNLGTTPATNGAINLVGMPEGLRLLSLADANKKRGWHRQALIAAGGRVDVGEINPFDGAAIRGRATRETTGGGATPLAGALVVGIFRGAQLLDRASGAVISLPPPLPADPKNPDVDYIAAFTDDTGAYTLGPALYGDWLIVTYRAGYFADAAYVTVSSGRDASGVDLHLRADPSRPSGSLTGTVAYSGTGKALVFANLAAPFAVEVPADRRAAIASAAGRPLLDGPWLQAARLSAVTALSGDYTLDLPVGQQRPGAFKFGFRAQEGLATITAGASVRLDFTLAPR